MPVPNPNTVNMQGVDPITAGSFNNATPQMQAASPAPPAAPAPAAPAPDPFMHTGDAAAHQYNQDILLGVNPNQNYYQPQVQKSTNIVPNLQVATDSPQPQTLQMAAEVPAPSDQFGLEPTKPMDASPIDQRERSQYYAPVYEDAKKNADRIATDITKANDEKAATLQAFYQDQAKRLDLNQQEHDAGKAASDKRIAAIEAAITKGQQMSIDPDRYWKRKGTASNILSAIGVGLGSFGSHGGTSAAGAMLNQAIANDIDAQKEDISNYWQSVKQQYQLEDTAWNRTLAHDTFNNAQYLARYKLLDTQLAGMEAKTQNIAVKEGLADMRKNVDLNMLKLREQDGLAWAAFIQQQAEAKAKAEAARQAGIAARQANLVKLSENYDKQVDTDTASYEKQGMDHDEAKARARQDADQNPRFAPLADAGYQGVQYNISKSDIMKRADKIRSMNEKDAIAFEIKYAKSHGKTISVEQATKQVQAVKSTTREAYSAEIDKNLAAAGIYNPHANIPTTTTVGEYKFKSKEDETKFKAESAVYDQLMNNLKAREALRKKHGGSFSTTINPEDAKLENQLDDEWVATINQAEHGGILQPADIERLNKLKPSKASSMAIPVVGVDPDIDFKNTANYLQSKKDTAARTYGGVPIQKPESQGQAGSAAPTTNLRDLIKPANAPGAPPPVLKGNYNPSGGQGQGGASGGSNQGQGGARGY